MSRNTLKLDTRGIEDLITKLEGLNGEVKKAVTEAMEKAADKISRDTDAAMAPAFLPAHGKYSQGDTKKAIVKDARATWSGTEASVGVGFDYSKKGSGGVLITGYYRTGGAINGTARMAPNQKLKEMYKGKKYMLEISNEMADVVNGYIVKAIEGN